MVNAGIEKAVDTVQGKAAEVLKVVDTVVNNPVTNAVAPKLGPNTQKNVEKVQKVVTDLKNNPKIVGKNKFFQYPMPAQPIQQQVFSQGPPVVTTIQALDQYGNIIAQSSKGFDFRKPFIGSGDKFVNNRIKKSKEQQLEHEMHEVENGQNPVSNFKPGFSLMHGQISAAQIPQQQSPSMMPQYQQNMQMPQ